VSSGVTNLIFTRSSMATPDTGKLALSDSSDTEDLFASPSRPSKQTKPADSRPSDRTGAANSRSGNGVSRYNTEQTRNALLQKELESVRGINQVIEGVVSSLECAKGNMDVSLSLIDSALRQTAY
jgi:hypothetical protein